MPQNFVTLVREHEESIVRAWVDGMYAEQRTEMPAVLSYGQLVDHLPDTLQEIASALDQGALIDEVARELIIFRRVFNDFLWREGFSATEGDIRELRDALRRADRFVDELLAQVVVVYAASLRPPVATRTTVWPPPRRRRTDFPENRRR